MAEYKQKLSIYLLCITLFSSIIIFPGFAHASDLSVRSYNSPPPTSPYTRTEDEPRYFRMIGDFIIARPLLLAATVLGTGLFVASLPFSILGGNVKEAANTLVVGPAWQTFGRCLGCRIVSMDSKKNTE